MTWQSDCHCGTVHNTAGHRNLKVLRLPLVHQHEETRGRSDNIKCLGMSPNGEGGIHGRGCEYSLCHWGQIGLGGHPLPLVKWTAGALLYKNGRNVRLTAHLHVISKFSARALRVLLHILMAWCWKVAGKHFYTAPMRQHVSAVSLTN